MHQPDRRAPSIDLAPREPEMRVEFGTATHDPVECSVCRHFTETEAAELRSLKRWSAGLLVAFCLGFIVLGAYFWIDVAVRTALAVWERWP